HTICLSDWSSGVCSSDLIANVVPHFEYGEVIPDLCLALLMSHQATPDAACRHANVNYVVLVSAWLRLKQCVDAPRTPGYEGTLFFRKPLCAFLNKPCGTRWHT